MADGAHGAHGAEGMVAKHRGAALASMGPRNAGRRGVSGSGGGGGGGGSSEDAGGDAGGFEKLFDELFVFCGSQADHGGEWAAAKASLETARAKFREAEACACRAAAAEERTPGPAHNALAPVFIPVEAFSAFDHPARVIADSGCLPDLWEKLFANVALCRSPVPLVLCKLMRNLAHSPPAAKAAPPNAARRHWTGGGGDAQAQHLAMQYEIIQCEEAARVEASKQ